jgi:hypothetical protein
LGPYEPVARDIIFGLKPLSSLWAFEVMIQRYRSKDLNRPDRFYTVPVPLKFGEYDAYGFALNGFRIMAKLDDRPFPDTFKPFVLNGNTCFRGIFVDLEKTTEFEAMNRMAVASIKRQATGKLR